MKLPGKLFILSVLIFLIPMLAEADVTLHHKLSVSLNPASQWLEVSDEISLPEGHDSSELLFYLHDSLVLAPNQHKIETISHDKPFPVPVKAYRLSLDENVKSLYLKYAGPIHHGLASQGEEYARSFSETPGMISEEGVFLAGSSVWYPWVNGAQVSFELVVDAPADWKVISQGQRMKLADNAQGWQETHPQEEIYLIAAPFYEYSRAAGRVQAMAFLREDDLALANKYLEVTAQYIEMYAKMLGPYPYSKFALVENFWETGYGMPSFTLLGPKVIRLPFILHSSYPHEILHNWWGNGVYVDYQQGNWAEGLTSYLADHLIQEQRGSALAFRRNILQNYADFVSAGRDFPLSDFTARHSSSSEAVGYGKAQMLFHMLRMTVGDEVFVHGLQQLYRQYQFKQAGFHDLANIYQQISNEELGHFFGQWVQRAGAPELEVREVVATQQTNGWVLKGVLKQSQSGEAYHLSVPLAVTLKGQDQSFQTTVVMTEKQQPFSIELKAKPLHLDVDPAFDLFRRVSRAEIPAALSQAFGAEKVLLVLPSQATVETKAAYEALANTWASSQFGSVEVRYDGDLTVLPTDRAVWLLGGSNRFAGEVVKALGGHGVSRQAAQVTLQAGTFDPAEQSIVLTARRNSDDAHALVWLAADRAEAISGLGRKLPHYRKYSYLVFDGDEPSNQVKGQWTVVASPMSVRLDAGATQMAALAPRQALAQLPALFDEARMMADVRVLAGSEMEGRGLGSVGLDKAADYIAEEFRKAGLQPGYPSANSYLQEWTEYIPGLDQDVKMKNVVGFIPGRNPDMAGQSVVVGAHYDHLGFGWPDVRKVNKGKLHAGADDNASGVAVMLELVRIAAQGWRPDRSIVFVAFTGEEAGRLGSEYFVRNYSRLPAREAIAMINLDTVGRLGAAPVTAFGTGSATEWVHIFRGIGFVTGLQVKGVPEDFGASDQRSYLDAGVPAVQLFGTVHEDFHSPMDLIDKVDAAGMVKVATVLKEAVEYLANRPEPMTASLSGRMESAKPPSSQGAKQGRKVSMGTVPDFAFAGPGVKLTDVVPDSPAALAGLEQGDVIISINGQALADLRQFAKVLRGMSPGQRLMVEFLRSGQRKKVQLELVSR